MGKTANINDIYVLKPYGFVLPQKAATAACSGPSGATKKGNRYAL